MSPIKYRFPVQLFKLFVLLVLRVFMLSVVILLLC